MYEARFPVTLVELGFNFLHSEEYDQKTHSIFVHDVVKNSPAERAGLRAGDRIIAVNGEILSTSAPYDKLYATAHPGDPVALTITHDGEPAPLELHGTFRARPSVLVQEGLARSTAQQILALYPALFLLVGFAVLFLKLDDPYAWLLALMFCAFAGAADILNPRVLSPSMQAFLFAFRAVFNGLLCALFYLFFARFPVRSPLDRFLPWLKWFGLALAVVTVFPALPTGEPKFPAIVSETLGDSATRILFLISRYGLLLLGLVSLVQNASLAAVPAGARRKSRVILLGSIFGVLPILLERALRDFTGFRLSYWFDTIVVLILFFYPLSFAYAVVKHRVMEIPVLLRRSAHYVLVQKGFTVSLFVMAVTVISLFTHLFSRFVQANPNLGMALGAVFGIALVWLSAPAIRKITLRIDRAFFRSSYDASKILQDLAEKIRAAGGRAELAALLEKYVHDALHPKTFACFLDENGSHLSAVRGTVPPRLQTIRKDDTFLMRMAERGKSWDFPFSPSPSLNNAVLLAPLSPECLVPIQGRDAGLLGLLVLGPRLSEESYSGEDKQLLESAASQAGIALENFHLAEKIAERLEADRHAAREMDIAREVQARLFPQVRPTLRALKYSGQCIQVREVSGDYYDFLDMGPGRLGFVLADISGKGIAAALLMANLQANLRSQYAVALEDPQRLLQSVNRLFFENTPDDRYATLFFADYDDATHRLRYINCGHNSPVLLRANGEVERLSATATVLGLFENWHCSAQDAPLHTGDLLAIFSDGVTEAMNPASEEFGEARFIGALQEFRSLPPDDILAKVVSSVQHFTGGALSDDLTLVIARIF